jgi:hypothetical protein
MTTTSVQDQVKRNSIRRIALLGDSIFDNEPYVLPGKAVIDQINQLNKNDWSAELLAVDGATTRDSFFCD